VSLIPRSSINMNLLFTSGVSWRDIHRHPHNKHPARSSCKRARYARTMEESEESRAYAYVQLGRRNNMHNRTCCRAHRFAYSQLLWRFNDRRDETMRCMHASVNHISCNYIQCVRISHESCSNCGCRQLGGDSLQHACLACTKMWSLISIIWRQ
jgi:hypothetical protein